MPSTIPAIWWGLALLALVAVALAPSVNTSIAATSRQTPGSNMNDDKARQRMLKLLALAKRGEGGERENAQRFLESMLKKHGMTLADLDEEALSLDWMKFPLKTALDRRLLAQVAAMVLKSNSFLSRQYRGEKAIWLNVTKVQFLEIELHYRAFQRDLKKALEQAYIAFINRNDIFSGEKTDRDEPCQHSAEDLAAIAAMMKGMQRTAVRREIGYTAGVAQ